MLFIFISRRLYASGIAAMACCPPPTTPAPSPRPGEAARGAGRAPKLLPKFPVVVSAPSYACECARAFPNNLANFFRQVFGLAIRRSRAASRLAKSRASSSRASPDSAASPRYAYCARTKTARASTTSRPNRGSRPLLRRPRPTSWRRRSTATTFLRPFASSRPTTTPSDSLFARTSFQDPLRAPPIRVTTPD